MFAATLLGPKQAFKRRVRTDIDRWVSELAAVGCPAPFHYTDNPADIDSPVGELHLVSNKDWEGGFVGKWIDGMVLIRAEGDGTLDTYADDPTWTVGLHELGHALGLFHSEFVPGEPSIMTTPSSLYAADPDAPLPARDVRAAACVLGCGPC